MVEKILDVMMNILQKPKAGQEKKAIVEEETKEEEGPKLSYASPE